MTLGGKKATALLFIGDLIVFALSLWLTLLVRYAELPGAEVIADHARPFLILFALWTLIFYMSGLYGKRVLLGKRELPGVILRTQITNIILAALFFFAIPGIGIAPKTNLVLYLVISLALIFTWRIGIFPRITKPSVREQALLIGSGPEVEELLTEVNGNARYHIQFVGSIEPKELASGSVALSEKISSQAVSLLIVDTENPDIGPLLSRLYELAFSDARIDVIDFYDVYEEVFDRVPLSLLQNEWFIRNTSEGASMFSLAAKRLIDITGGLAMGLVTLVITPLVFIAMRIEGPGPLFIQQDRIGLHGTRMRVYKFRTMQRNDRGAWKGEGENEVTKLGNFLRMTSLDEFPQFLNILSGELSLIGPRSDIESLAVRLKEAIPYYSMRYAVKPGITGWAQINQQYEQGNISPQSIEETKTRLAYDFYYIKNQSLGLDIVIALKTVKRMFFRVSTW